jgi:hypothetical protein
MNFGSFLMVATILSQTGGTTSHNATNYTETPDTCFAPSCAQEDWAKATLQIGNQEGGSIEWCTQIPKDRQKAGMIEHNMKKALDSIQAQADQREEQLTPEGVGATLEEVMRSYCTFVEACQGKKTCTSETYRPLPTHRYDAPVKEKKKPQNLHTSNGRGGR